VAGSSATETKLRRLPRYDRPPPRAPPAVIFRTIAARSAIASRRQVGAEKLIGGPRLLGGANALTLGGVLALILLLAPCVGATASARPAPRTLKKAAWGSAADLPIMRDLGVGIFEVALRWGEVAPESPVNPTDPSDPAYRWPAATTDAIEQAHRYHMRVAILIIGSPRWTNGGRDSRFAPNPGDLANFATASARRYSQDHLWMIWSEPSRPEILQPQVNAPHIYARMLDASYAALKRVSRRNLVIGGLTTPQSQPFRFVKRMRLRNGKPPRLDMFGHNPFTARTPNLNDPPSPHGAADFSDLRRYSSWIDQNIGGGRRHIPLFLSEFGVPTDHSDSEFNFFTTRRTQAQFIGAALRIVRRWSRIYTLGYVHLRDLPGVSTAGLLTASGAKKPGYFAFKQG
jgi:hypothetical protein